MWEEILEEKITQLQANDPRLDSLPFHNYFFPDQDQEKEYLKQIIQALMTNEFLIALYLKKKDIGFQEAEHIGEMLKSNVALKYLALDFNNLGSEGTWYISEALKKNIALRILGLGSNNIGSAGALYVSNLLKKNFILEELYLFSNCIGNKGVALICEAFLENTALKKLDLSNNGITDVGASFISKALDTNVTLHWLNLEDNNISSEWMEVINAKIERNQAIFKSFIAYLENLAEEDNFDLGAIETYRWAQFYQCTSPRFIVDFWLDYYDKNQTEENILSLLKQVDEHIHRHFFALTLVCKQMGGENYSSLLPPDILLYIASFLRISDIELGSKLGAGTHLNELEPESAQLSL